MQFFVHLAALDRLGQRVQDEGVRGIARTLRGGCDARFPRLGTWKDDGGLYVDGVLQGGRHRYTASPVLGPAGGGKGSSLLASVEGASPLASPPAGPLSPSCSWCTSA